MVVRRRGAQDEGILMVIILSESEGAGRLVVNKYGIIVEVLMLCSAYHRLRTCCTSSTAEYI